MSIDTATVIINAFGTDLLCPYIRGWRELHMWLQKLVLGRISVIETDVVFLRWPGVG